MQDRICQVDETSCNARPDHTFGSLSENLASPLPLSVSPSADTRGVRHFNVECRIADHDCIFGVYIGFSSA
jgi:hypothetical protein